MPFENKVVVITGADGNLGRAVAAAFARAGASLVLVGLHQAKLAEAFGETQANIPQMLVAADLTRQEGAADVAAQAVARFGRVDVLCNLAGGFRMGPPVHATPAEDWDFLFSLNVRSALHMAQAIVPGMLAQGSGKAAARWSTWARSRPRAAWPRWVPTPRRKARSRVSPKPCRTSCASRVST